MFSKNPRLCPIIVVQNLVLQCMIIVNRSNLFHYNAGASHFTPLQYDNKQ